MIGSIRMIGIALSAVIALIGVLNFINSVVTGILARKHEFAVLCSIGMTEQQLKRMLLEESLYYVLISGGDQPDFRYCPFQGTSSCLE